MKKILDAAAKRYYIATGILMFFSFPSYDIWFLKAFPFFAWFSLIPVFLYVRDKKLKEVFSSSFITGLLGTFLVYGWISDFGYKIPYGGFIILVLLMPFLTVFFASKIIVAEFLSRRFERLRILIYPAVWIFIDWIESIGFLAFPWTYWGYSQFPFTPFVQLSSLTGILGITFILICANYIISDHLFFTLKNGTGIKQSLVLPSFRNILIMSTAVILSVFYGFFVLFSGNNKISQNRLRVACIQSCIDPWESWFENRFSYLSDLKKWTDESMKKEPDFIIWSESATLEYISFNYRRGRLGPFDSEVLNMVKNYRRPLLTGEIGLIENNKQARYTPQNNAVLINENGEVAKTYSKLNLVPFGEWFPYEKWFPFVKEVTSSFGGSDFVPGSTLELFETKGKTFGTLVCYEGIFFTLCRKYKQLGIDFFVNIANLNWTKGYGGTMQAFASAVFRAAENGVWFISAGNSGYTAIVDPYGRVTTGIPILKQGFLVGDVDFSLNHDTIYTKTGDVVLYIAMLFIGVLCAVILYDKFKKGRMG